MVPIIECIEMQQQGGEVIAAGTQGCIVSPKLTLSNNTAIKSPNTK